MKKGILASLLLVPALLLGACTEKEETVKDTATKDSEKEIVYRIGTDATYAPFEFEVKGEYKGIDIDLLKAIAKDQEFEFELAPMDFKGIIPAMQAGQLDAAIAGISITDERKKVIDYSNPYFDSGLTIGVKSDNDSINSVEDLKGKKVIVKKGTTGSDQAAKMSEEHGFELIYVEDTPSMFLDVKNGNADALIDDYPVVAYAIAQDNLGVKIVGDKMNGEQYGMTVLKGKNKELLEKLNTGLENVKASGEYQKILDTYISEQ